MSNSRVQSESATSQAWSNLGPLFEGPENVPAPFSRSVVGRVADTNKDSFTIVPRSGRGVRATVPSNGWIDVEVLRNLGEGSRNRLLSQDHSANMSILGAGAKRGTLALVKGTGYFPTGAFVPTKVVVPSHVPGKYNWEEPSWYRKQMRRLFQTRMDIAFGDKTLVEPNDVPKLWRTNVNGAGIRVGDTLETATLSRFTYGCGATALATGDEQALRTLKAVIRYQLTDLGLETPDPNTMLWAHSREARHEGERLKSDFTDAASGNADRQHVPLYEQIYSIAGPTMGYLVTRDRTWLTAIEKTLNAFEKYYRMEKAPGYYSHIDEQTFSPREASLGGNASRMNWNSIGDHIPAYLCNLILALGPKNPNSDAHLNGLRDKAENMLEETTEIICDKLADPSNPFVQERFIEGPNGEYVADKHYDWQQDRAIGGHNFKIIWNLTRAAFHYQEEAVELKKQLSAIDGGTRGAEGTAPSDPKRQEIEKKLARVEELEKKCVGVADRLVLDMIRLGLDPVTYQTHDGLERDPKLGGEVQLAWDPHSDFWQVEQALNALKITYGRLMEQGRTAEAATVLEETRKVELVWNSQFLDHEQNSVHFRLNENHAPMTGGWERIGGPDIAGYHESELAFLNHIMTSVFVTRSPFDLHFSLAANRHREPGNEIVSVAPDFLPPGAVKISAVRVNDVLVEAGSPDFDAIVPDPTRLEVNLGDDLRGQPVQLEVTLAPQPVEKRREA